MAPPTIPLVAWDPIDPITVDVQDHQQSVQRLEATFERLKQQPQLLRRNNLLLNLFGGLAFIVITWLIITNHWEWQFIPYSFLAACLPGVIYRSWINTTETDLVKLAIARTEGWHYAPNAETLRIPEFAAQFPAIFHQGHSRSLADQFWGTIDYDGTPVHFWSAQYRFTTGSGRSQHQHHELLVAIQLRERIERPLFLGPDEVGSLVNNPLTSHDLDLESNEFNRRFRVHTNPNAREHHKQAYRILDPLMMETLLAFQRHAPKFRALFVKDTFMVSLPGAQLEPSQTNFLQTVSISDRDRIAIKDDLLRIASFASQIRRQID